MQSQHRPLNFINSFTIWTELTLKTVEMMTASAQVISHRTARIVNAGLIPATSDRREFRLMGNEKMEALADSLQAVGWQYLVSQQQLAVHLFRQWMTTAGNFRAIWSGPSIIHSSWPYFALMRECMASTHILNGHLNEATATLMHKGLMPIHSRVTANAKRLSRLK